MSESKGLWFMAGLGVGAAVALLFAPRSGEETRQMLSEKAGEGREVLGRKAEEYRQQAIAYMDRGREVFNRQVDQFQAAVDAGKQAFKESSSGTGSEPLR